MKTVRINALADLVKGVKRTIDDSDRAYEEATRPSVQLTVGADETGWGWQTGDNSFMGAAYHYRYWGVVDVYRNSNSRDLARDIKEQIEEAMS